MSDALSWIGVATGVAGTIMGYVAYRRTGAYKALDLRLQLRKDEGRLRAELDRLPTLLEQADGSKRRIYAAEGNTGRAQVWLNQMTADRARVDALRATWLQPAPKYDLLKNAELESRTIDVHAAADEAEALRDKYVAELASDDRRREQRARAINHPPAPPAPRA